MILVVNYGAAFIVDIGQNSCLILYYTWLSREGEKGVGKKKKEKRKRIDKVVQIRMKKRHKMIY